jgi:hypothetical protein
MAVPQALLVIDVGADFTVRVRHAVGGGKMEEWPEDLRALAARILEVHAHRVIAIDAKELAGVDVPGMIRVARDDFAAWAGAHEFGVGANLLERPAAHYRSRPGLGEGERQHAKCAISAVMDVAERQKPTPGSLYLDHVAHFVPDLDAAARLVESLGFTPTPESAHRAHGAPAGTSNRCLMFEEGYVEILAPTLDTANADRVRAHMARYDGVHLACFGTPDARFEHQRLAGQGFEPEPLVDLQRTVDGGEMVRFSVVYVPPGQMPEGRVQYAQQLTPEVIWKDEFVSHANGVTGVAAVYVVADDPAAVGARWARFTGLLPRSADRLVALQAARGRVLIGTQDDLFERAPAAPALAGYALTCRHPEAFAARCSKMGLAVRKIAAGHAITLPPALGGTWLV